MRLLNYSKKEEGYKHLTYTERLMIERWYNKDRKSKAEIDAIMAAAKKYTKVDDETMSLSSITFRNYFCNHFFCYNFT